MTYPINGQKVEFMPGKALNPVQPMRRPSSPVAGAGAFKLVGVLKRTAIAVNFLMPLRDLGKIKNVG